ncbi:MAG: cell division protein FtsK [Chloroflexi bacterium]|nr:cell division protein FtsK [Chloroflexota bacterium]
MPAQRDLIRAIESHAARLVQAVGSARYWRDVWLKETEQAQTARVTQANAERERAQAAAERQHKQTMEQATAEYQTRTSALVPELNVAFAPLGLSLAPFDDTRWQSFSPAADSKIPPLTRIGALTESLSFQKITLPAAPPLIGGRPLVFKAADSSKITAAHALQSLLLRLLATIPPAKLRFTFLDPIGLGQNVAPFMHLADYDEQLVTGKAWTEPNHIEQRLADLTEHMENVIQKYLRNQYASIEDYNAQAGEVAEPYRVLVVMDFPANFSETAARRLVSIAQNGPRCGVYAIVLADTSKQLPYNFNMADLERASTVIGWDGKRFVWQDDDFKDCLLELDAPPDKELFDRIIQTVGEATKEASKVEVAFERMFDLYAQQIKSFSKEYPGLSDAPNPMQPATWWRGETDKRLIAPLGRSGAKKVQCLDLGKSTAQHALIAGKTGSGKSTLLHTLITSVALTYSPDELELYLIDFKKGVEFKTYAANQLPHARVIAIESEREFGLSVLQGLDAELKRRGDLFRKTQVDELGDYREKSGQSLPRVLLLVDEFQEFFTEDDPIASQSAQILDRLVRQGRAFGMHVLLGSQTLAGAYSLARSTIDQMAVRIALQCSEADSRLILADDNPAARLLSRPGEAIYNSSNGTVEGNNRFQVAWLTDEQHEKYLAQIQEFAKKTEHFPPQSQLIFEGNAPAEIEKNRPLHDALSATATPTPAATMSAWLGEPIAIRPPIAATFRRQSGSNLLVVGQSDEAALGTFTAALTSLVAQSGAANRVSPIANLNVLDFGAVDGPNANFFQHLNENLVNAINIGRRRELATMIDQLAQETQRRLDGEAGGAPIYLFVYGLQRARDLRSEDATYSSYDANASAAPNPAQQFNTILREGPDVGIFTIVWCDTLTNLNRAPDRRALREFAMRVVMQMSGEDSANLIDTPTASKLGPYRALFYSEEEGRLEKFRPYALPTKEWLTWAGERLKEKRAASV